ncbi:UNVERIFIED_ORG: putative dinucleotide-binding enzyme [Pseudomonas lini]|uniref:3-hydroxyisobutyrate dehydrogenase n=1 Tax=Pseudomonas viciae TaxID=2505979 RepID=A0A4V1CAS6_9PSED|nr:NAD(P)-binding domain-containing protein [Pseudomonas viciae]QBZ89934.1 3-hydroxyisobutyrate dehydrogenase [Pseudomonas viciae]WGO90928.1 NAD(P)-binding domain-containing protein [Pseudomonas viciae]
MKIGIIGTGNIGGTIARKLRAAGHEIRVANSGGVDGVRAFAEEIGAEPVDIRGAVDGVDVIVLSIPLPALSALPSDLFTAVPDSVPVVDTSNYYPGLRDPQIAEIDQGMTESVWVTKQIGCPVVKAFNNVLAYTLAELGRPKGAEGRLAAAVAGDNHEAKETVMSLVDQAGFDPVDGGFLEKSWRQQPSTPSYCCDYDAKTMRRALLLAVKGQAAAKRDELPQHFMKLGPNPTHADVVAMNRSFHPLD